MSPKVSDFGVSVSVTRAYFLR